MKLFTSFNLGNTELKNRIVMAPMTRSRADHNIPNELMAEYYAQRSGAGLIITEGTAPSANGLGYPRIPGIYSDAQIEGWKQVTAAIHDKGSRVYIQLMHTGRVSHPDNMEAGTSILAPSAIQLSGEMYTDSAGPQAYPVPEEMSPADIKNAIKEYVSAAKNSIAAGFDGVELHGANGYLIDQFINTASNKRSDEYGGSVENRCRFAIDVATEVAKSIGADKTGIRLSPYGVFNDMEIFKGMDETFEYLAKELGKLGLSYIHIVDHSAMGAAEVPDSVKEKIRAAFGGVIIISGGFDRDTAEKALQDNKGELVAFGRPYLANPDLDQRMRKDLPMNAPDFSTFYTPGPKGYTDYPASPITIKTH